MKLTITLASVLLIASTALAQDEGSSIRVSDRANRGNDLVSPSTRDTTRMYLLPEVLITATRSERNPFDLGRSVSVISRRQITSSLQQSLGELLAEQEGIYLVGIGQNPGMNQSLFMRGASNNQTAILIDDIRVTDPSSVNSALDLSELSSVGLDRIEIVRGSHSTLYGSSAIGGVINIVTRKGRVPGVHAAAEVKGGLFGRNASTFSQSVLLDYVLPSGFYAGGEFRNTAVQGLDATVDTVSNPRVYKNRDRDGFDKRDWWGKVGFKSSRVDLSVSWKDSRQRTDLDKAAYLDDDNSTLDFRRAMLTYGASYELSSALSVKVVGGYSAMRREAVDDSSAIDRQGTTDHTFSRGEWNGSTLNHEIQTNFRLPGIQGVAGAGWFRERMSSKSYLFAGGPFGAFEFQTDLDSLDLNSSTSNLFSHIELSGALLDPSLEGLSLALGGRLNRHSAFGRHLTYEVNPTFKVSQGLVLYASYSTGFNAPSLYQLYAPDRDFASGIMRGNRDLQPENSSSYEVGIKHATGGTVFSMSYFRTLVDNSIEYVYLWDKTIGVDSLGNDWLRNDFRGDTYLNVGEQTTTGFEFGLSSQVGSRLWFSGNVSLVSGKLSYRPSEIQISQTGGELVQVYSNGAFLNTEAETPVLVRRPNTVNINVTYKPSESMSVLLAIRHVGERSDIYYDSKRGPYGALGTVPVESYTLVDVTQRFAIGDALFIAAKVENVFNTKYSEINGFTTRGRGIYLSLRYSLGGEI